jgi:hypothetical protein
MAYDVLVRIAAGLGVPREAMGLGYGAYAEGTASAPGEEADKDVLRRQFQHLLALAGVAAFGTAVPGVGELIPSLPSGGLLADTPSWIGERDVAVIRDYTESLRAVARTVGGQAGPATALWPGGQTPGLAQTPRSQLAGLCCRRCRTYTAALRGIATTAALLPLLIITSLWR